VERSYGIAHDTIAADIGCAFRTVRRALDAMEVSPEAQRDAEQLSGLQPNDRRYCNQER